MFGIRSDVPEYSSRLNSELSSKTVVAHEEGLELLKKVASQLLSENEDLNSESA